MDQFVSVRNLHETFPGILKTPEIEMMIISSVIITYFLNPAPHAQLFIEAETNVNGFIAIDDITITPGICQGAAVILCSVPWWFEFLFF